MNAPSSMSKVAVIGLGNIATRHRRNLKALYPGTTLFAMSASGRVPEEAISDCDGIVGSIDELIAQQVQFVIVASPAPFHALHAIALLEANIPVLIEKPLATTSEDCQAIRQAAEQNGTPVSVGYCLRYLSSSQQIKTLFDQGILGELYHAHIEIGQYLPDWRPSKDYRECVSARSELGGGVLLELSHELDYSQWLLGPLEVQHAILRSSHELGLEVEDSADIMSTTQSGAVVTIHLDFLQRQAYRRCRFVGQLGALEWDLIGNSIYFTDGEGRRALFSEPEWDKNQMYLEMIRDFYQAILGKSNNVISLEEALNSISMIEKLKSKHCERA
ncbi:oxidoreductase [Vibrio vulnificus]|uniref:Gfo/Idh/MocA family protein n=1 Tax=Vibrio vulnificus TaxID=672 RepID=UPI000316B37B|nr:Gfo/Idh/MocA family oxidoreductase [Vibrio vulnificus]SUP30175.1 oxidoreductase [Vibrio vulnificus]